MVENLVRRYLACLANYMESKVEWADPVAHLSLAYDFREVFFEFVFKSPRVCPISLAFSHELNQQSLQGCTICQYAVPRWSGLVGRDRHHSQGS